MTITKKQVEKIDEILNYLIDYEEQTKSDILSSDSAANKLQLDEEETDHLFDLLQYSIQFEGNTVVKFFDGGYYIQSNYNTKKFISAGGAVGWFEREKEKQDKEKKRQELEQINLENAIKQFEQSQEEFKLTQEKYKHTKRQSNISIAIAILSALVALITLFLQYKNII